MEAVRGSIMAEFLTVRREMSVQMHGTSVSSCVKTVSRRLLAAPPSTACTSGQHNLVHRISKSSLSFKDGVQSCKSWIVNGKFQQTRNRFAGSLKVRASQYENVIPLPVDNELASLESLLEVSPSQPKLSPPSPADERNQRLEALIERVIFDCRFLTLMAVVGSLAGSLLCFFKGSLFVVESFVEYFQATWQGLGTSQVIFLLVEAVDVYLMGTVMLIFGMGLYELFVSTLEVAGESGGEVRSCGSNLFGLFRLRERPKWLEIRSLDELKTKLGHVIVMILLVGMFEKSKKVPINSGLDFLCFSASILLSSGCLYLLSKLHNGTHT